MKLFRSVLIAAVVAVPLFAQAPAGPFTVDKAHSSVQFKIRHMMSKVAGSFRDFDAVVNLDRADLTRSNVQFTIQAASIDTGNDNRDEDLRGSDFFDVTKYPTITFKSTSVTAKSKNDFSVTGDFTMHGVTKRITLPVTLLGFSNSARGERAGFEIDTKIDRKDYGIVWNRTIDEGGVLLGDDVEVSINLELVRKPAAK